MRRRDGAVGVEGLLSLDVGGVHFGGCCGSGGGVLSVIGNGCG